MSRLLMRSSARLLLLSLTMFASGCTTVTPVTSCGWVKVITVSRSDVLTDETARQILGHNEKVEAICGGG